MVSPDKELELSIEPEINYSHPSIDVLFETAADTFRDQLLAIILSGANADGTAGITHVRRPGGETIAQDPREALYSYMPSTAIQTGNVQEILTKEQIVQKINNLKSGSQDHPS